MNRISVYFRLISYPSTMMERTSEAIRSEIIMMKTKILRRCTGALVACLLLGAGQLETALVTHVFTGTITDPGAAPGVSIDDPFTATLSYDDSQAAVFSNSTRADYAVYSLDLVVATFSTSTDPNSKIAIHNDSSGDQLSGTGVFLGFASLILSDSSGTVFNSSALPTSLSITDFDDHRVFGTIDGGNLIGNIVDIQSTVVPVPAAVWLFGSALGLLGWMKRKA